MKNYEYIIEGNNKIVSNRVLEHYKFLIDSGYEVIFTALQGSQNYGLDEYTDEYKSDVDTKSIVLPNFKDFVCNKSPVSTVEILENNEHAEVKDIRVMCDMFKKMNISYIELLYSEYIIINPKYKDLLTDLIFAREKISAINKNQFLRCIKGMALEKQKALCHPYPNLIDKIEKYGYDGKQLSHTMRLFNLLSKYSQGINIKDCFTIEDEDKKRMLMNAKKQLDLDGNILDCKSAIEMMDTYINNIKLLVESLLSEKDQINEDGIDFLNNFKYNVLKRKFKEELLDCENF